MGLHQPGLLLLLAPAAVLLLLLEFRIAAGPRRRVARWLARLAVAGAILVALAGPHVPGPGERLAQRLVVAVDASPAMGEAGREEARSWAERAAEAAREAGVAVTQVAFPAAPEAPGGGDLRAGLERAALAFRTDEVGRVLLLGTGRGRTRGAGEARRRLAGRGIEVRARALPSTAPDAPAPPRLVALRVPEVVRGPFEVRVRLPASAEDLRLRVAVDGRSRESRRVGAGTSREVALTLPGLAPGEHEIALVLESTGAEAARLDLRRRRVRVRETPRVLALLAAPEASLGRRALSAQGLHVEAIPPEALEARLGASLPDLVLLDAASAARLPPEAQRALARRVGEGLGLLFEAGGDRAAWGRLAGTTLGRLLPLRPRPEPEPEPPEPPPPAPEPPVEPPEDDEGPGIEARRQPGEALPITLLLLIDRSLSMHGAKLGLAIEGARRAAGALSAWDRVGVITFADDASLDFAPQSARHAAELPMWLSTVQAGGGTDIFRALRLASQVLARETTPIQHVLLLTDGRTGGIRLWPSVVGPMGRRGVTLTAVGIGDDQDRRELRDIIQWAARGSLVSVHDPRELPTVLTKDTRGIRAERDREAERLDRLPDPDRPPEQDAPAPEPEPRDPPAPPAPRDPARDTPPPETEGPAAPARLPLRIARGHQALEGIEAEALPRVGPPRRAAPASDALVLLVREGPAGEEAAPALAARRFGLGRVIELALPADDPGLAGWALLGQLYGQAARAVMAPEGAFRFRPQVALVRSAEGDAVRVEWPPGDATRVRLAYEDETGHEQDLGWFDPAVPDATRLLPEAAEGAFGRIHAELEDGRQVTPRSLLRRAPDAPPRRAGDARGLARLFGPVPEDPLGGALPERRREQERPLWHVFLWIAAGLLPLDVLLHRHDRRPGGGRVGTGAPARPDAA